MSLLSCAAIAALCAGPLTAPAPQSAQPPPLPTTVTVALNHPLQSFSPQAALGGALDGHSAGEVAQIYTPANLRAMSSAGLGAVDYRLRTELGVQSWHYAAAGAWSEAARRQGYWTGAARPTGTEASAGHQPLVSWGYSLPRRGDTVDQADDEGYSRLDDGRLASFWKSNPYLDSYFTHEPEGNHRQWVLIDLGRPRPVQELRIAWYAPWARRIGVQYWVGRDAVLLAGNPPGHWRSFPRGRFSGHGGVQTLRLARRPLRVRFVRVLLSDSSHTLPRSSRSHDVRDRLGYAIRELYLGYSDNQGRLHDLIEHRASNRQTVTYTSSTDPWSRARERNPGYEQPSFQTVLRSGLTRGEPLLVPVPVLYGTPQSAVAELRYLQALGVPLRGVELGEEPDGQLITPEDYGALYIQFARTIHRAFPSLALGGPGFQTSIPDWQAWPNARGERSWTERFLDYLRARGALHLLSFFSFEWYPFDDVCENPAGQLAKAADLLTRTLALQRAHGLPRNIPIYITEYGYSAFAGEDEVTLPGALLDADTVGTALSDGVSATYMYGYEPEPIMQETGECDTWGNLVLLASNEAHRVRARVAAYWETWMLTHLWTQPSDGTDTLYATTTGTSAYERGGHALVRAYALRRPDGSMAVLLLNMSPRQPYEVRLSFSRGGPASAAAPGTTPPSETPLGATPPDGTPPGATSPSGAADAWQLSELQYRWHAAGGNGHPSLSLPPARIGVTSGAQGEQIRLPPYSLTVLRAD
jgi:hypothetical protein